MEISGIIEEAKDVAGKYNLELVEIDRTDNIISLKLLIDHELFIQIYGNTGRNKLNLALVFKNKRLYGYDFEGGKYHCHPFDDPDGHISADSRRSISIQEFVQESMRFLEENNLL
ncbi:MAG: hypothetical protein HZA13_04790 [Nitrospirae bacterium]|nr:hypothetical protein [Nitrospirota bacterium]